MLSALVVVVASGLSVFGTAAATAQSAATGDFDGGVEVGERKIHLECKGAGAPAVILISGYRNNAEIWTLEPGPGLTPVFAAVARFTRVCAYDRPGTILDAERLSRSDTLPMPRTAEAIAAELDAVLDAAGTRGPYVLAAHSLGGLFARLYAASYPQDVAGLVLVDAWQEDLDALLGPTQWAGYVDLATPAPPGLESYADLESVDFGAASARMREAVKSAPLPAMPLYVISRGKPVQLPPGVPPAFSPDAFEVAWREGQRRLAALLPDARHRIAAESGHYIQIEQPDLVVEAIHAVVDGVRDPALWTSNEQAPSIEAAGGSAAPPADIAPVAPASGAFAGLVDIGGGRKMYLQCRGAGAPTVVLIAGLKASADDWNSAGTTVFSGVADVTRVCAYDRPPLGPLPLVVLSADRPWGPQIPALIANGTLPAEVPADFGYITDAAQKSAQEQLATLVPGARHIWNTNSGHEIHKERPQLVTDAIIDVVGAVREGETRFPRKGSRTENTAVPSGAPRLVRR